jgi:thioredoxin 1
MQDTVSSFTPDYGQEKLTFEQVSTLPGDVILEFGAPWCEHCKMAFPAIQEVLIACNDKTHIKVYDGKGKRLGRAFKVKLWPTLIFLRDGKEVSRIVRPVSVQQVHQFVGLK